MALAIPIELVITIVFAAVTGIWALWSRLSSVRTECLASVAKLHEECTQTERDIYATMDRHVTACDAAIIRTHTRVDELQATMVSKNDLEPLRADIRQMREQTSIQITTLTADIHKLLAIIKGV